MTEEQAQDRAQSKSRAAAADVAASSPTPKFYCALALPVGTPSLKARLAGMALLVPAKPQASVEALASAGVDAEPILTSDVDASFKHMMEMLHQAGLTAEEALRTKLAHYAETEGAGWPQVLWCQLPLHAPWSPSFLWKQGLSPLQLERGRESSKFLQSVKSSLQPESELDVLVGFALHHYLAFNAMALQGYMYPDFFLRFNYVIDLKTALLTCAYFGQNHELWRSHPLSVWRNLVTAAQALGFVFAAGAAGPERADEAAGANAPAGAAAPESAGVPAHLEPRQRVAALSYVYRYLWELEPKIMGFLQRSWEQRLHMLTKSQYLVTLDEADGLALVRVVGYDLKLRLAKVISLSLTSKRKGTLKTQVLNLDLAPLLAPSAILTPERQAELHIDLAAATAELDAAEPETAESLSDAELQLLYQSAQRASTGMASEASGAKKKTSKRTMKKADASVAVQAPVVAVQAAGAGAGARDFALLGAEAVAITRQVAAGVGFSAQDLPFYQRYWLSLGEHYESWWQLHALLEQGHQEACARASAYGEGGLKRTRFKSVALDLEQARALLQEYAQGADAFGVQALCYLCENEAGAVDERARARYAHYVQQLQAARVGKMQQEVKLLLSHVDEKDSFRAELLAQLGQCVGLSV